jgi:Ca-activated chloride channel family protein
MFRFQHTEYLLALAAVPLMILLYFLAIRWKQKTIKKIGDEVLVKELIKDHSPQKFAIKFLLVALAFVCCSFALSNLRRPSGSETITRNGIDVMIALDVSKSMLAQDVKPSRLERAKQLLTKLVDKLSNDRIGIVVFAGKAYMQMPLTADHGAAKMYIGSCGTDMVQTQGTVISEALKMCFNAFSTHEKKYKAVVLISDGEDHDEGSLEVAGQMAEEGVIINTVGIGSPDGAPIADPVTNEYKKDKDGNTVVTKLNETELKDIADKGNGIYQLFSSTDDVVARLDSQFETMDQRTVTEDSLVNYQSFFQWFLIAALLFLLAESFLSERKMVRKQSATAANRSAIQKTAALSILTLLFSLGLFAQKENEIIKKGNDSYVKSEYGTAAEQYKKVAEKNASNATAQYNLGNALYKDSKTDEALKAYDNAIESAKSPSEKEQAYYNKAVVLQNNKKLPECIDAYKKALRISPDDQDARLNLQKALKQLQQEQEKKKDKDKKDKKDEDKKKDQQKKPDENKDQQPKPQPSRLSKKDAEEKLKALLQQEKNLQDKLRKTSAASPAQPDKDW